METAGELAPPLKDKAWRDQKNGRPISRSPILFCAAFGVLERDPQAQADGSTAVDALLREAVDQTAEIWVGNDVFGMSLTDREKLTVCGIDPDVEVAKQSEGATAAA
jgi:hypothetical protein